MTLEIIRADALDGIRHGFFTRKGGVSRGIYGSLNCGVGSGDDGDLVAENKSRVAAEMGAKSGLETIHQVHSADVVTVTRPLPPDARARADGLVTDTPGLALAVLTADCQPVLFADPAAGVIGAAHAGWRGAIDGVLENTLTAMESLGADRRNITAVIGPCISQANYEVGPEFFDDFMGDDTENQRFFAGGHGDRLHFDLAGFGLHRLRTAGVGQAEWTGHCTYADEGRFFSYRRTTHRGEPDYGRMIAAITL